MKTLVVVLAVLAAAVLILGRQCFTIHQSLVAQRDTIDRAWVEVDAALNHRADLVPDLVEAVTREAPGQAGKIRPAAEARTALARAQGPREKIQANARLDTALASLLLLAENYPSLERGKEYADLLDALKGAEYQIAVTRRKYNEAVEHYNTRLELFPDNLVASLSRLGKVDAYFQTPAI